MITSRNSTKLTGHSRLVYDVPAGCQLCPDCEGKGCRECQSSGIIEAPGHETAPEEQALRDRIGAALANMATHDEITEFDAMWEDGQ